jgi:putative transposase
MAQSAQDNVYAVRINNTIKNEYLIYWKQTTLEQLKTQVDRAVFNYNNKRIHNNLEREIPAEFNTKWNTIKSYKNKKMIIFNNKN